MVLKRVFIRISILQLSKITASVRLIEDLIVGWIHELVSYVTASLVRY